MHVQELQSWARPDQTGVPNFVASCSAAGSASHLAVATMQISVPEQVIEVARRDHFLYYVPVERVGDVLYWSFYTRKNTIAFGLFYLCKNSSSASLSNTSLNWTGNADGKMPVNKVKEIIDGAKQLVRIEPSAKSGNPRDSPRAAGSSSSLLRSSSHNSTTSRDSVEATNVLSTDLSDKQQEREEEEEGELLEILPIRRYDSFRQIVRGRFDIPLCGTYVLCFDNTFSINTPKSVCFSVGVAPSNGKAPPHPVFSGWLLKKKRRRMQGWARRWFEINSLSIMTYYEDRHSPCRGAVDLAACSITKSPQRRMITIDSGTSLFHLKAFSMDDYTKWSDQIMVARASKLSTVATVKPTLVEKIRLCFEQSSKMMVELREIAMAHDDGSIKCLGPLEQAFASLSELHVLLQEFSTRIDIHGRHLPLHADLAESLSLADTEEIFYDAQDTVLEDEEESSGDEASFKGLTEDESSDESGSPSASADTIAQLIPKTETLKMSSGYRTVLPSVAPSCNISFTSILRKNIGKDWSSIPLPVVLNEPLSILQRLAEELEYSSLLDRAAICSDPLQRLAYVAAFAVSSYASFATRADRKPFNPMLGETYECIRPDRGFRFVAEKVSHKPLIVACHAESLSKEGGGWRYWMDQRVKSKFWGKSMEYMPMGNLHVEFPTNGDHFIWNRVTTCIRNVMSANKWVENYGDMRVVNVCTGDYARINFKSSGFFSNSSGSNEVVGIIQSGSISGADPLSSRSSSPMPTKLSGAISRGTISTVESSRAIVLRGRWDDMLCQEVDGPQNLQVIWKAIPPPAASHEYYNFSRFAVELNDLTEELRSLLPSTDSRFRPDQRALEDGKVDLAEQDKIRIEQKQREKRMAMEAEGLEWSPLWFKVEETRDTILMGLEEEKPLKAWRFNDKYWECREARNFGTLPDLF